MIERKDNLLFREYWHEQDKKGNTISIEYKYFIVSERKEFITIYTDCRPGQPFNQINYLEP